MFAGTSVLQLGGGGAPVRSRAGNGALSGVRSLPARRITQSSSVRDASWPGLPPTSWPLSRRAARRATSSSAQTPSSCASANIAHLCRSQFAVLDQAVHGRPLVYLDNAATSQKPESVLAAMDAYYRKDNSNVHRGVHALSARATAAFEGARERVGRFINAASSKEIVWTRNASEAINLVANTWGSANVGLGDEIVLSVAEHHGNLVPWQLLAQRSGAKLRFVKLTEAEELDLEHLESLLTPRAKLVALPHMSNTLGFVTDVGRVVDLAGRVGAKVLLDACQSVPNRPVDVKALGVDFLVASGHKMCGPTGIGFLWSRLSTLEKMPPWMGGGEMIEDVFLERSTFAPPPLRFEAGTPAIAEAIGLEAACDFLSGLGMDRVQAHEDELAGLMHDKLSAISGLRIYGPPPSAGRAALAAFNVQGMHATDISSVMDSMGVALRSGHMCTQPLHRALGVSASVRASAYVYNTPQEVDAMVEALKEALAFLRA